MKSEANQSAGEHLSQTNLVTEPERAKVWTALSHYPGDSLHTSVSIRTQARSVGWHTKKNLGDPCVCVHG